MTKIEIRLKCRNCDATFWDKTEDVIETGTLNFIHKCYPHQDPSIIGICDLVAFRDGEGVLDVET